MQFHAVSSSNITEFTRRLRVILKFGNSSLKIRNNTSAQLVVRAEFTVTGCTLLQCACAYAPACAFEY